MWSCRGLSHPRTKAKSLGSVQNFFHNSIVTQNRKGMPILNRTKIIPYVDIFFSPWKEEKKIESSIFPRSPFSDSNLFFSLQYGKCFLGEFSLNLKWPWHSFPSIKWNVFVYAKNRARKWLIENFLLNKEETNIQVVILYLQHCQEADCISKKVIDIENSDPNKRSSSSSDSIIKPQILKKNSSNSVSISALTSIGNTSSSNLILGSQSQSAPTSPVVK